MLTNSYWSKTKLVANSSKWTDCSTYWEITVNNGQRSANVRDEIKAKRVREKKLTNGISDKWVYTDRLTNLRLKSNHQWIKNQTKPITILEVNIIELTECYPNLTGWKISWNLANHRIIQ